VRVHFGIWYVQLNFPDDNPYENQAVTNPNWARTQLWLT
jgi:hypothetical protein